MFKYVDVFIYIYRYIQLECLEFHYTNQWYLIHVPLGLAVNTHFWKKALAMKRKENNNKRNCNLGKKEIKTVS